MKIKIEKDQAKVELLASEKKALLLTRDVCDQLHRWLDLQQAADAALAVDQIIGLYAKEEVPDVNGPENAQ